MTGKGSKAKGSRGERELVKFLESLGYKGCRRGLSQCVGAIEADVVSDDLKTFWIECKRTEKGKVVYSYLEQAEADCKNTPKIPIVLMRSNNKDKWLLIGDASYLLPVLNSHK